MPNSSFGTVDSFIMVLYRASGLIVIAVGSRSKGIVDRRGWTCRYEIVCEFS